MNDADREREILEAIEAASVALKKLNLAKTDLKSASGWGVVDMLGGGLFTSLIKHSNMDDAKKHIEEARIALRNFSKELMDVDKHLEVDLDTFNFLGFADAFMDNFFADWAMQSHIAQAQQQVDEAIYQVQQIKTELERL